MLVGSRMFDTESHHSDSALFDICFVEFTTLKLIFTQKEDVSSTSLCIGDIFAPTQS